MRAVVYARYSSDLQRDASIEDQIEVCRRYIDRQGWSLLDIYEDAALSGGCKFRPAFQQLVADLDRGAFDVVVVEALDRLGRKLADVAEFHDRLSFAGIKLHTVNYGEITPMHVAMGGMMAQMFLSDLRDKTRRGQLGRARQGKIPGGLAYGYRSGKSDGSEGAETGERHIDDAEAEIIGRIFREFADGHTPRQIAVRLNREGRAQVAGPGATRRCGAKSSAAPAFSTTRSISGGSTGTGAPTSKTRAPASASPGQTRRTNGRASRSRTLRIVEDELWHRVKARQEAVRIEMRRDEAGNALNRAHRRQFLLSGLLVCGCCGGAYTMIGAGRYGCATRRSKGTCSNRRVIARQEIEDRVLTGLKERLLAPELVKAFVAPSSRPSCADPERVQGCSGSRR